MDSILHVIKDISDTKNKMILNALKLIGYNEEFIRKNINDFSLSISHPFDNIESVFYKDELLFNVITDYDSDKNITSTWVQFPDLEKESKDENH